MLFLTIFIEYQLKYLILLPTMQHQLFRDPKLNYLMYSTNSDCLYMQRKLTYIQFLFLFNDRACMDA